MRSELRETPDLRKIARAVIAMALAQAEADAAAEEAGGENVAGDSLSGQGDAESPHE